MEISITSKKNHQKEGYIKSFVLSNYCTLQISYSSNPKFLIDLQKLLLKYYDLKILSGRGNVYKNKFILSSLKKNYKSKTRGNAFHNKE